MKQKGFTIIELVIAIVIFSVIIVYMYQAVSTTKKGNTIYERSYEVVANNEEAKKLFYNDIFNQVDPYANISFKDEVFYLRTNNSLHSLVAPYVAYFLKDKNLIRIESIKKLTFPLKLEYNQNIIYEIDYILKDIENFHVSVEKNNYLINWTKKSKTTTFEIKLPYYRKVLIVESKETNSTK